MFLERIAEALPVPPGEFENPEAAYWRMALESAGQGVWDYNNKTGRKSYSETWYTLRGLTSQSAAPESDEHWLNTIHPEDRFTAAESTRRLNSGEISEVKFEYRERHAHGHWIWIMCRGKAISWDSNGLPTRFLGIDTDITNLKNSEESLRRLSRRLELSLSCGRIGVWQYNVETDEIEWDEELRKMYGIPASSGKLPRDAWEKALHPEDKEWVLGQTARAFFRRANYELDYRILRADGETRYIRSRVSFQTVDAEKTLVIGVNWDATAEREHALALETANREAVERNNDLEKARRAMEYSALHDALTGLPNRRLLEKVHLLSLAKRSRRRQRVAVLHLDLDRFKQINDAHGHAAGDSVLVDVAEGLRKTIGTTGLVARIGGDEFAVFIEDAPPDHDLANLANLIIDDCSQPVRINGEDCRLGVSIGIAATWASDAHRSSLFVDADMALYKAKKEGRGKYCFYTDSLKAAALITKRRNDDLLAALERDEFFCVYQPQFAMDGTTLTGVEALVRWKHPTKGILQPGEFIPAAEKLDIVHAIDRIVSSCARRDIASLNEMGIKIPRLSLNICERRLHDEYLISDAKELLALNVALSIELLESSLLDDQAGTISERLTLLRELGVEVEIDDFGTGHASIVSLLTLQPDRLKIDHALVCPILGSSHHRQVLRSIVEIARTQGIAVLAEGVESKNYLPLLRDLGCDEVQGFALARPMDTRSLATYLTEAR